MEQAYPKAFLEKMEQLLGGEYPAYVSSLNEPAFRGVRLNTLKGTEQELRDSLPFSISSSPFSSDSFYGPSEKVGTLPAHHAGLFYSQEPSASSAVTLLDPQPGEWVLDLCAAPGGKSGQIAARLQGEGLLWSNEIVRSRATILLSNLERLGVRNSVVSSCHPEKLCQTLAGAFDRVLVDAPCSGEGMFRKDPQARQEWTPESPQACANRQREILKSAAKAVRPGGVLVYSTCTFSKEENEETILWFLQEFPEFESCDPDVTFGRPALCGVSGRRIYPMDGGEGHFVAKLRKKGEEERFSSLYSQSKKGKKEEAACRELLDTVFDRRLPGQILFFGSKAYLAPENLPVLDGLGVLRAGVELGELRGSRVEPSHGLFMAWGQYSLRKVQPDAEALAAFLRGEEIDCEEKGYTAVLFQNAVIGFGKASGGRLKNRYPKGLRNLK